MLRRRFCTLVSAILAGAVDVVFAGMSGTIFGTHIEVFGFLSIELNVRFRI